MSTVSHTYPILFRHVALRDFAAGDQIFVKSNKNGYVQFALCEFIKIDKGLVKAKVLKCYLERGDYAFDELTHGNIIRKRANNCFLSKRQTSSDWPLYSWFTDLDTKLK
jgi:hypothetical protein